MTLLINSFFSLIKVTICLCYEYRTIKLKPQTEVSPIKQYVIPGLFWNGWVFWPSDELGRYPLIFDVNKIILKYISYLQSKEQSSLVIQSLVMSIDLDSNGKTCFYANLIKMLNYYNIPFNFYHGNYPAFCRSYAEEIYYPLETFPLQFTKA